VKAIVAIMIVAGALLVACGGGEAEEPMASSVVASPEPTVVEATLTPPTAEESVQKLRAVLVDACFGNPCYGDPEGHFQIYYAQGQFVVELNKWLDPKETAAEAVRFMKEAGVEDLCNPVLPILWASPGPEVPSCPDTE
jgi:hypothetical protein